MDHAWRAVLSKEATTAATRPAPLPLPSSARINWNWNSTKIRKIIKQYISKKILGTSIVTYKNTVINF